MREILFRGKRIDSGEWAEGFHVMYSTSIGYPYSYTDGEHHIFTVPHNISYVVDPETVCQYTGLTDRNGKKIFEGDIIRRNIFGNEVIGTITWADVGFTGFKLRVSSSGNTRYFPIGRGMYDDDENKRCNDEVIGNIFDNPELLGASE